MTPTGYTAQRAFDRWWSLAVGQAIGDVKVETKFTAGDGTRVVWLQLPDKSRRVLKAPATSSDTGGKDG